jgi:hypothetical protein
MKTLPLRLLVALSILGSVAACSAGAPAASRPPSQGPSATPTAPPPTQVPGGNTGAVVGGSTDPGGGAGVAPDSGRPQFVVPKPGTRDPRPVAIEKLDVQVEGRRAVAVPSWWSGVEPCTVLDSVELEREGNTFSISVREGSGAQDVACIELALLKATSVDLGELEPGEYTVVAKDGRAKAIRFTIG